MLRRAAVASLVAVLAAIGATARLSETSMEVLQLGDADWNASVTIDLDQRHPVSPWLYGIFFEEVSLCHRASGRTSAVMPCVVAGTTRGPCHAHCPGGVCAATHAAPGADPRLIPGNPLRQGFAHWLAAPAAHLPRSAQQRPALLPFPGDPQIGHAGDGGLYAELVQDRSFDALAAATGFRAGAAARLPVDLGQLAASHRRTLHRNAPTPEDAVQGTFRSKADYLRQQAGATGQGAADDGSAG